MCDKKFKSKSDLQRHRKGSSDDRPYKGRSFKQLSHLRRSTRASKHLGEIGIGNPQSQKQLVEEVKQFSDSKDLSHPCIENGEGSSLVTLLPMNEVKDEDTDNIACKESQTEDIESSSLSVELLHPTEWLATDAYPISEVLTYQRSPEEEQLINLEEASEDTVLSHLTSVMEGTIAILGNEADKDVISQSVKHVTHMKEEERAIPVLTTAVEQSFFTFRNNENVGAPSLQLIDHPDVTFTEQMPPENLTVATVVEQSISYSENDNQSGCVKAPFLSEVVEQFEFRALGNFSLENQSSIDSTSYSTFLPVNQNQIISPQETSQLVLSVPHQGNSSLAQSMPNFSLQPFNFVSPDNYALYSNEVSNSISMPCCCIEENAAHPTFISEANQDSCTKQPLEESNDLFLTLTPPYVDSSSFRSLPQHVNSSVTMLDENCNQITICTNGNMYNSIYNTMLTPVQNVLTTLPINVDNFVFF